MFTPLGTDELGRDILSRIIYSARMSLLIFFGSILLSGFIGITLVLVSGYLNGRLDFLIMNFAVISVSPFFAFLLAFIFGVLLGILVGPSFSLVVVTITVPLWPLWACYIWQARNKSLSIRRYDFIARARAAGASHFHIMLYLFVLQVKLAILIEFCMSFLGIGIPRPNISWGLMVTDGSQLFVSAYWISMFPGLTILLVILSLTRLSSWLRDQIGSHVFMHTFDCFYHEKRAKPVLQGRPYHVYHTLSVIHFVLYFSLGLGAVFGLTKFYPWYFSQMPNFSAGSERDGILSEVRSGNMIYRTKSAGGAVVGELARGLMALLFLVLPVCVSALTLFWGAMKTGGLLLAYFTTRYTGFTPGPFFQMCAEFKGLKNFFSEQS
jgi:peptide/nickel transport system permease protein